MISEMVQPEVQRQVRQQRADIESLYELVECVDQKVDALDVKLDQRVDALDAKLVQKVDALDAKLVQKVDALDAGMDSRLDEISGQLAEVLRQLGR